MSRLTRPGPVLLLVAAATLVVLAGGGRAWVTGRTSDAVLGAGRVSATGTESVPGLVGLALVVLAATVAAATAGRIGRTIGLAAMVAGTAVLAIDVGRFLLDPDVALGRAVAHQLGRTGSVASTGNATAWAYAVALAVVVLAVACVLAFRGRRSWRGLSSRFDQEGGAAAGSDADVSGRRGERARSTWEQLSEGQDPTDAPADAQTDDPEHTGPDTPHDPDGPSRTGRGT